MNCPFCNHEIPDRAKFCSKCGGKIPQRVDMANMNQVPPKVRYCKDCGAQMVGDGDYCENCKTRDMFGGYEPTITKETWKNAPPPEPTTVKQVPPKKKKSIVPTILLILLCLLLSASAIFLGYSFITKSFIFSESSEQKDSDEKEKKEENTETTENTEEIITTEATEEKNDALWTAQQYRKDAEEYNGHAYAIFNFKEEGLSSFSGCERFCEEMGGHLAVIDNAEENEFLYNYLQDCGLTIAFFGYTDQDHEGEWRWVNGSTSTYTNWCQVYGKEQPNNGKNNSSTGGENYAEFYKDTADGTWNDAIFGKNTYRFICEWE